MKFDELGLAPTTLSLLGSKGIIELTPIQEKTIPAIVQGKDVVGHSVTGSGKTLAFALPLVEKVVRGAGLQVLVLVPTRELCVQVKDVCDMLGRLKQLHTTAVYGGVSLEPQAAALRHADILVATPGRLLDHMERRSINLQKISWLVLDEVDKMFEMGFVEDVERIIRQLPQKRQTMLFSATFNPKVHQLATKYLHAPLVVKVQTLVDKSRLTQQYYVVDDTMKFSALVHFLKHKTEGLAMVFCGTRDYVDIVARNLRQNGINAMPIHGGLSQNKRLYALDALKKEHIDVLVATDVAARGLDIKNVTNVYNYDAPKTAEEYIHRIGRTARAGANGAAISLVARRDFDNFRRVLNDHSLQIVRADLPAVERARFNTRSGNDRESSRHGFRSHESRDARRPASGSRGPRSHTPSRGRRFSAEGRSDTSRNDGFGGRGRS